MNCPKFQALNGIEKSMFIGELVHAAQSDDALFEIAEDIIRMGALKGLFEKVTFLPPRNDIQ